MREAEILISQGNTTAQDTRHLHNAEQVYYRWRKECGEMKDNEAKSLKELEKENARLKKIVAD